MTFNQGGGEELRTFLVITFDRDSSDTFSSVDQTLQLTRIPVIIHDNLFVSCEQALKIFVRQRVRVSAFRAKDHKVGNVHDTNAKVWHFTSKKSSGRDDFESKLDADTDDHAAKII
jgi:hypothetical protein